MGFITIFTIDNCPHCKQATTALEEWRMPYSEISLSVYPQKRKDLLELAGKVSVPQVFFNKAHIGGVDETIEFLRNFCISTNWASQLCSGAILESSLRDQLERDLSSGRQNARFMIPIMEEQDYESDEDENDTKDIPQDSSSESATNSSGSAACPTSMNRTDITKIRAPDGTLMTVLELTEHLKQILQYSKRRWNFTSYKACCTADEIVGTFVKHYDITRAEAEDFGKELHRHNILHHVCNEHDFQDTPGLFFRLQCYHTPNILNSYRIWLPTGDDPEAVLTRVLSLFRKVEEAILGHDGTLNYRNAYWCSDFPAFEDALCELQQVNLSHLKGPAMFAFGVNLYNVMLKYAFMKVGVPASESCRASLLNQVKFNVGGHLFSPQEWLDGILRGNRKSPVTKTFAFGKKDPRLTLASHVGERLANDCRIHFAIHVWSRSRRSPPVKVFTAAAIDEELSFVARAFCEEDDNVAFNVKSKQMRLSEPFRRYKSDFVQIDKSLPKVLLHFVYGSRKARLERFFRNTKSMKLTCRGDDWTVGTGDFVAFDAVLLAANVKKFGKCVRSTAARPVKDSPPGRPPKALRESHGRGALLITRKIGKPKGDRTPTGPRRRSFIDCPNDMSSGRTLPLDLEYEETLKV